MELSFAKLMYIYRRLVIFKLLNCLIWSIFSWEELNSLLCCPLVSWRIQWRASMYAETPWRALANCRCSRGPKEGQGKCAVCHIRYAYDFGIIPVFNGFMRFIYPYPSGLCHCHWGNHMIASVTHKLHFVVFCCVFLKKKKKNATKCNLCVTEAIIWLPQWHTNCILLCFVVFSLKKPNKMQQNAICVHCFWYVLYVWEMHCQWLLQISIL